MRKIIVGVLAVASLSLAGCKHKPTVEELSKMKDEACACADKACAEKISKQMDKAFDGMDEKDMDDKTAPIVMDISMCLAKQGVH